MSSLYRKYRPANFTEVIGQDHISENIKNSLKKGTVGHAYLFSGPRGTGKTTLARLFAKAVNCQSPIDGIEPCGKCEICLEMANGSLVDIIEIDAASNRGIDEIRELRERVAYAPSRGKYKVYIIDEVHMLTKEAFNALLKTLEEPPAHVIFILATTELHKVPDTIISRCQRYQFHRAGDESLRELLKKVVKQEKIGLDDEAIEVVVARAEGSFRDALTLLGNVASQDKKLDAAMLRELLGMPETATIEIVRASLTGKDSDKLMATLREFINGGGDIIVLVKTLTDLLKKEILDGSSKQPYVIYDVWLLEQLLVVLARVRGSADPTALLLAKLYELASIGQTPQPTEVFKTIPVVEQAKLSAQEVVRAVPVVEQVPEPPTVSDIQKPAEIKIEEAPVAVDAVSHPVKSEGSDEFWNSFLVEIKEVNHAIYAVLRSAELESLLEDKMITAVKFRFYSERLYEPKNRKQIETAASKVAGRAISLECHVRTDVKLSPEVKAEEDLVGAVVDVFEIEG